MSTHCIQPLNITSVYLHLHTCPCIWPNPLFKLNVEFWIVNSFPDHGKWQHSSCSLRFWDVLLVERGNVTNSTVNVHVFSSTGCFAWCCWVNHRKLHLLIDMIETKGKIWPYPFNSLNTQFHYIKQSSPVFKQASMKFVQDQDASVCEPSTVLA